MKLLDPFADPDLVARLCDRIADLADGRGPTVFMEVCGTHTMAVGQWGLRSLLPDNVQLVSGPGCPVCVTPASYIDNACRLALARDVIVATFGDLVRVPGLEASLEAARGEGADVRTVYSPAEAIALARGSAREVVFLAIGFETTAASNTAAMKAAHAQGVANLSFYCSLRVVPPALQALLADPDLALNGFLLPGHVSVIIGLEPYRAVLDPAGSAGVIVGFEPVHILHGIEALLEMVALGETGVRNLYPQVVRPDGNPAARAVIDELLEPCDALWRGIGAIPGSGYRLREAFADLDAERRHDLPPLTADSNPGCRCGDVLKGLLDPENCPLFGEACTPVHPVGPCMVSSEGTCSAHFKYGG